LIFLFKKNILSRDLDLKKPIYTKTACYGHFGRSDVPWEQPKQLKL
jgi:S-adenosylmethionine synthetase